MTDEELDQMEEDAIDGCLFDEEALQLIAEVRALRRAAAKPSSTKRWLPWDLTTWRRK